MHIDSGGPIARIGSSSRRPPGCRALRSAGGSARRACGARFYLEPSIRRDRATRHVLHERRYPGAVTRLTIRRRLPRSYNPRGGERPKYPASRTTSKEPRMSQPQQAFKWVGTRAGASRRRPQGHGSREVRRRLPPARDALRKGAAQSPRARPHPGHRHLARRGAARREGGDDRRGPARPSVPVRRARAARRQLLARHAQHHGAGEGALRGPRGGRGGGDQQRHREPGARPHRRGLRGAAPRHRRGRGDGGGRPAVVRGHGDARDRSCRRSARRTSPSGSDSRSAMSTPASPEPTRSSRSTTGPRPSTRRTSSRRPASRTGRAAARRSCGAPARGTSRCATSPRS